MGKGDKRSKRGKITIGSYGKTRPHKVKTVTAAAGPAAAAVVKPAPAAKAPKAAAPKAEKKKKA